MFQDGKVIFIRHGSAVIRVSANRLTKAGVNVNLQDDSKAEATKISTYQGDNGSPPRKKQIKDSKSADELEEFDQQIIETPKSTAETTDLKNIKSNDKIKYRISINSRAGKSTGKLKHWYNVRDESGEQKSVDLESIEWTKEDTRTDQKQRINIDNSQEVNVIMIPKNEHDSEKCIKAKYTELEKLKEFNTYEIVQDQGQYRISTTWVMSNKGDEVRARLVARGYEDNQEIQKDSPTVGKSTMRIIMAISAAEHWEIKTTDIKSAFLQGQEIDRDVFLTPPKEAGCSAGFLWKLKCCLYGLNDAARQFYKSVEQFLIEKGCQQSSMDPALFFLMKDGTLQGIIASHVDDFLHCGTQYFENNVMTKLRQHFEAGKVEGGHFKYVGFDVIQSMTGITLDHGAYTANIENYQISPNRAMNKNKALDKTEQTIFRKLVGRINWAVQGSRLDMAFELLDLSTKLKQAKVGDLSRAIKVVSKIKEGASKVFIPAMSDKTKWNLLVYTDAAHANLNGVGSVGAHLVFLTNMSDACTISWSSTNVKRVVRSTIAAEALSLQEGLEDAIHLKTLITELLPKQGNSLPIVAIVDNKSVIQALNSTKMVDDKRLRLDIASIKESMKNNEVAEIKWAPGGEQLANCLTKRGAASFQLMSIIQNGKLSGQA